ncbi:hypothetical protein QF049_002658 [Paenibacillus sp. W4I10]|nr:hypothetical protein [Paenibacillus sp. W4I10]
MEGSEAPILTPQAKKLPSFTKWSRELWREAKPRYNAEGGKAPVLHEAEQGAGQKAKPCPKWSRLSLGGTAADQRCARQQAFLRQPLHSKTRPNTDEQDGSPEGRALWGPPSEGRVWVGATTNR